MNPRIAVSDERKLVGCRAAMSFADYRVADLWKRFMPRRREILHCRSGDLISMAVYPPGFFASFDPSTPFAKWAAAEVSEFESVPVDLETYLLKGGLYAVFDYKGSGDDHGIFEYILGSWLPDSDYRLDDRPHFEVLGDKYRNHHPDSEEEIWIPIGPKP